jgi:hypothetical protein
LKKGHKEVKYLYNLSGFGFDPVTGRDTAADAILIRISFFYNNNTAICYGSEVLVVMEQSHHGILVADRLWDSKLYRIIVMFPVLGSQERMRVGKVHAMEMFKHKPGLHSWMRSLPGPHTGYGLPVLCQCIAVQKKTDLSRHTSAVNTDFSRMNTIMDSCLGDIKGCLINVMTSTGNVRQWVITTCSVASGAHGTGVAPPSWPKEKPPEIGTQRTEDWRPTRTSTSGEESYAFQVIMHSAARGGTHRKLDLLPIKADVNLVVVLGSLARIYQDGHSETKDHREMRLELTNATLRRRSMG